MLRTKSIRTPKERTDGLRILVARFRGRGVPKSAYDVWMPSLGPSERLLREFLGGKVRWRDYTKRYTTEMFSASDVDRASKTIKNHGQKFTMRLLKHLAEHENVTLLCHCPEDERHCHRHLLRSLIDSNRI